MDGRHLAEAVKSGEADTVTRILRNNPKVDVNWRNEVWGGWAALHEASWKGIGAVVEMLLAHPDIDVNLRTDSGETPLFCACYHGRTRCVSALLGDPRVDVKQPVNSGFTPLWWTAYRGSVAIIMVWIASGREMDLGETGNEKTDVVGIARKRGGRELLGLLERFRASPRHTRFEIRAQMSCHEEMAAEMFAVVVFHCDGLLRVNRPAARRPPSNRVRFLAIATRLPMELQMVLCHRAVGSMGSNISTLDCESAFCILAGRYPGGRRAAAKDGLGEDQR